MAMIISVLSGCKQEGGSPVEGHSSINENSSTEGDYSIQICGFSDSLAEKKHNLEYYKWNGEVFYDNEAPKHIEISFAGKTYEADYKDSRIRFFEYYKTHRYKTADCATFYISSFGTICNYFHGLSEKESESNVVLTEAECIQKACSILNNYVNTDDYTIQAKYNADDKRYDISFRKYVGGFMCADLADISIRETGDVYSFSSEMLGQIPVDADIDFDKDMIEKQVIAKLDNEYAEIKATCDSVQYNNIKYYLTKDENGKFALVCSLDVDCITHYEEFDELRSELIQLFIQ